jgi:hypothetical protein
MAVLTGVSGEGVVSISGEEESNAKIVRNYSCEEMPEESGESRNESNEMAQ